MIAVGRDVIVLMMGGVLLSGCLPTNAAADDFSLSRAVVVVPPDERGQAETMAVTILVEEVARRTGIELPIQQTWPAPDQPAVVIASRESAGAWAGPLSRVMARLEAPTQPEGFAIKAADMAPHVVILGSDSRGAMYGVGRLLREMRLAHGTIELDAAFSVAAAPQYAARGHEMGYRARANSYDAWSPEQFDQYIREQIIFGMNCVQGIPFQDSRTNDLMSLSREDMNRAIGQICERYDVDYWVWTPVEFSLTDQAKRQQELDRHEAFYQSTPRLDAVFVPGGDPGDNPPELVLPFMKDLAARLEKDHPQARVWVSLQDFDEPRVQYVMDYIAREQPDWLGGIVADTSALPVSETRRRLLPRYPVRWYPDITHTVLCQFPVNWWDPAFALTLGREPTNPRPVDFAAILPRFAPHTDGFVTYSDGMNDDVNKAVWSMLGWDSDHNVRELLMQYSRFHFGDSVAEQTADGLLGLENNWRGGLAENAGVDGVLALWQTVAEQRPGLRSNWRFQQHLMRACYDAYTRHRLIYERELELQAMRLLAEAPEIGADKAIDMAGQVLQRAVEQPCRSELRERIQQLADDLFRSIQYQTSMKRYGASGAERGCVMDFLDRPLNDRWWLEDEFAKIRALDSEQQKLARLETVRTWKNPGPGSFYDDIGDVGLSPRVLRGEMTNTDPEVRRHVNPGHSWENEGESRWRLAWLHHMRWPEGIDYGGLDPQARYVVRLTGQGESPLRGDGVRLPVIRRADQIGEFQEFAVPPELVADGKLLLTWDPVDESHLHWQEYSHVAEVWLLKQ